MISLLSLSVCVCVDMYVCRMEQYFSLSREQVLGNIPMMFITFPSAKDPTANIRHPGTKIYPCLIVGHLKKDEKKLQLVLIKSN